eukprot:3933751-Rhodomonas_salina.1
MEGVEWACDANLPYWLRSAKRKFDEDAARIQAAPAPSPTQAPTAAADAPADEKDTLAADMPEYSEDGPWEDLSGAMLLDTVLTQENGCNVFQGKVTEQVGAEEDGEPIYRIQYTHEFGNFTQDLAW